MPPLNPAGEFFDQPNLSVSRRSELITQITEAPAQLREAVRNLTQAQLDTRYNNWTIRQIVHHLADSHIHSYARFKWALTEECPTIKPYNETLCAALIDSACGDIALPLALFEALHGRWIQLLNTLTAEQFLRTFHNPESLKTLNLNSALSYYAWHGRHHIAQIHWVRKELGLPSRA